MNDWNVPVNISILLSVAYSWSFNGNALKTVFEPRHDKINKATVRPAKTQISLGLNLTCSKIPEDTFLRDVAHIILQRLELQYHN